MITVVAVCILLWIVVICMCVYEVDIRTVDTSTLKDISDVVIDQEKPVTEKIASYIDQIGNPYCYKSHGVVVKINFAGERRLEDCIQNCMNV